MLARFLFFTDFDRSYLYNGFLLNFLIFDHFSKFEYGMYNTNRKAILLELKIKKLLIILGQKSNFQS